MNYLLETTGNILNCFQHLLVGDKFSKKLAVMEKRFAERQINLNILRHLNIINLNEKKENSPKENKFNSCDI